MADRLCFDCVYLAGNRCRRHAPVVVAGVREAQFPLLCDPEEDWCGDYEMDLDRVTIGPPPEESVADAISQTPLSGSEDHEDTPF